MTTLITKKHFLFSVIVSMLFAIVCGGCFTADNAQTISEPAQIDRIEINILESFPVQIHVRIYGILSDSCEELGEITQRRDGQTFFVTVLTESPAEAACAEVITLFEEVVKLDVYGLPAGTYHVDVNGVRGSFTLDVDNRIE